LIKKLWVKFDDMDINCFCEENNKKCAAIEEPICKEYVVKFTEIKRADECIKIDLSKEKRAFSDLSRQLNRKTTELKKSIQKFKVR
jgi:hypothetical protein